MTTTPPDSALYEAAKELARWPRTARSWWIMADFALLAYRMFGFKRCLRLLWLIQGASRVR